jgi:hypothetical protein
LVDGPLIPFGSTVQTTVCSAIGPPEVERAQAYARQ